MKTEFSHDISVEYPMSKAIQFFTPKGEESWVPGWEPRYIHPTHGDTCEEMLFTTGLRGGDKVLDVHEVGEYSDRAGIVTTYACCVISNWKGLCVFCCMTVARATICCPRNTSPTRRLTKSQARSLLSMARLNKARSRIR